MSPGITEVVIERERCWAAPKHGGRLVSAITGSSDLLRPASTSFVGLFRGSRTRLIVERVGRGACPSVESVTNRLETETSPYLLQHAKNPVDWWPWGPEAFAEAERLDRPVLLSVGYAAGATGAP